MRLPTIAEIRKGLAALAGIVALLVAQGVLTGTAERWAEVVLSVLTVVGVYGVPNARPPVDRDSVTRVEPVQPVESPKLGGYPGRDDGPVPPPT